MFYDEVKFDRVVSFGAPGEREGLAEVLSAPMKHTMAMHALVKETGGP